MGVTRRIVFPALRILILAAIAVALLKLAFAADPEPTSQPLTPSAEIADPQIPVSRGTIANTVTIDATITADAPVPVKATEGGEVTVVLAEPGEKVEAGDDLLEVVFEEPGEVVTTTDDEGNEIETQGEPRRRHRTIEAPVDGTVRGYEVLRGQTVAIGDVVGSIESGGFSVTGQVSGEDQYRLIAAPTSAEVTAQGGPAPFTCSGLTTGRTDDDDDEPVMDPFAGPGSGSGTSITCVVPAGVTVFDGLAAEMSIEAGRAEDVLVVPVTAVQGSFAAGNVWVPLPDGGSEERTVTLGLTDGEMVEVTEGLAEGDMILEFIPIPDDEAAEEEYFGPVEGSFGR